MIDLKKLREYTEHGRLCIDPKVVLELLDMLEAAQAGAKRYEYITEQAWFQAAFDRFEPDDHGRIDLFKLECARIIDAAMQS